MKQQAYLMRSLKTLTWHALICGLFVAAVSSCGKRTAPKPLGSDENIPTVKTAHYYYSGERLLYNLELSEPALEEMMLVIFGGFLDEGCGSCSPKQENLLNIPLNISAQKLSGVIPFLPGRQYIFLKASVVNSSVQSEPKTVLFPSRPVNLVAPQLSVTQDASGKGIIAWQIPASTGFNLKEDSSAPVAEVIRLALFDTPQSIAPISISLEGASFIRPQKPGKYWGRFLDQAGNMSELSDSVDIE